MLAIAETLPKFERNFDSFFDFLNDEADPATISPRRFGQVLSLDMQTLASKAHVHRNTISRAPEAESLQGYLRESVRVMRAAVDVAGTVEKAVFWFKNYPIPTFDYKTPQDLVSEQRTEDLVHYIQSLQVGFAG
jgi:uncharacterized protein (DUF2384 family)